MLRGLKERLSAPTSRALANAVTAALRDGELREGDRLPPIRAVAAELGLSPTTVSAAWRLLSRAGTVKTDGRRGTTVAAGVVRGPKRYRRALEVHATFALDLSSGVPDPACLPELLSALGRLRPSQRPSGYLDDPILPDLVDVLRETWPYRPEAITLADGAMDALSQICSTLLHFGDMVAVEHPGFPPVLDLLESVGVEVVAVRLDEEGPCVDSVRRALTENPVALFIQPLGQNPTGVTISKNRAQMLATLLGDSDVLIIEDDSLGALSHDTVSLGRWLPERTLHVRSFSKSHGPDLRLAAISGPSRLIEALNEYRFLGQGWTSRLLQALLSDLLTHPESIAAVGRAYGTYKQRRRAVVSELAGRGIEVGGTDGLNVWLPVHDEAAALIRLASQGIRVAAGRPFEVIPGDRPHLRVTTGLITHDLRQVASDLADAALVGAGGGPR